MERVGKPWIGVDLDGTLAYYDNYTWPLIGKPIPLMVERVKVWLVQGFVVKIFTARAAVPENIPPVRQWLIQNDLGDLEITCCKDGWMAELWDDRAVQVQENTGKRIVDVAREKLLYELCGEEDETAKTS